MSSVYKILCEVKWLHEYYLTLEKGETVFAKPTQTGRLDFVFARFVKDLPAINEDLLFVPGPAYESPYADRKIRIIPSYSGFKLAVKCRQEQLINGTIVYTPFIPLPDDLCIRIMIQERKNIRRYSGLLRTNPFHAHLYFTSNDIPAARTFPFLSSPVAPFVPGQAYEQSEIALHGANVRAFLNNGAVDPWLTLNGTGYINSRDACLLPLAFPYRFTPADGVTIASFTLKDAASVTIKKIDVSEFHPLQLVNLDFHTKNDLVNTIADRGLTAQQVYSLEVIGNNGYARTFTGLLFAADPQQIEDYAGIIDLTIKPVNAAFQLLDASGRLHTRIMPNGTRAPNPVFELWMNSKTVFWQYANNKQRKIKLTPQTQDLLADFSGVLVSKNPIPMSYTPVQLQKPDTTYQLLPNPDPDQEVKRSGSQLLLDMQVPESVMFPLV